MATKIETLKKTNGDQVLPRTHAKAVSMTSGTTVESAIGDINTAISTSQQELNNTKENINAHISATDAHSNMGWISTKDMEPSEPTPLDADTLGGKRADEFAPKSHTEDYNNPHQVTPAQIGAAPQSYILHGTIDNDNNVTLTNFNWDELVAAITSEEHPYVAMRMTTAEGKVIDFVFSNFDGEEYIVFVHNNGAYLESVELGLYDGVMYSNNLRQFVATNRQELNEDEKRSARVNIGATSVKLLWENPDPNSEFPGQTVTLADCWNRDAIEIVLFNQVSDSLSLINSGLLPLDLIKGGYGEMGLPVKTFAGDMHRSIYCTGDVIHGVDIEFGGCESPSVGGSVDNSLLVPYRIYGISYGVRI